MQTPEGVNLVLASHCSANRSAFDIAVQVIPIFAPQQATVPLYSYGWSLLVESVYGYNAPGRRLLAAASAYGYPSHAQRQWTAYVTGGYGSMQHAAAAPELPAAVAPSHGKRLLLSAAPAYGYALQAGRQLTAYSSFGYGGMHTAATMQPAPPSDAPPSHGKRLLAAAAMRSPAFAGYRTNSRHLLAAYDADGNTAAAATVTPSAPAASRIAYGRRLTAVMPTYSSAASGYLAHGSRRLVAPAASAYGLPVAPGYPAHGRRLLAAAPMDLEPPPAVPSKRWMAAYGSYSK